MGARIDDRVFSKIAWQVRVIWMTIESELKDAHSGQGELISKGNHVGSNEPKILSNEREVAQFSKDGAKEVCPRPLTPIPRLCRERIWCNMPGGTKAPEMVQSHDVNVGQQGLQPVDAPAITGLAQTLPVINRV